MSLDDRHLQYPWRRRGMDHDRYDWSMLTDRPHVQWPDGKSLAVWINVSLEHFPLNPAGKPLKLPGAMTMPYPDLRHYTLRDYGNRVGIYRFLEVFRRLGVQSSFAMNAELVTRYPALLRALLDHGGEFLGHSWNMDTPHAGGLAEAEEATLVERSLAVLRSATGQRVRGWLGPGKIQSPRTPELLKAHGVEYFADWVNDELPYPFRTAHGPLWSLPLTTEIEDRFVVMDNLHAECSWAEQVMDACDFLLEEGRSGGGRLLAISLHPWVMGQPHRMKHLEAALGHVMSRPGVWNAQPGEILDAFIRGSVQG